jgi:hypothetical protein
MEAGIRRRDILHASALFPFQLLSSNKTGAMALA